jgi:hypothetical protein
MTATQRRGRKIMMKSGTAEFVGEVPRTGGPHPGLEDVERLFARKYFGLDALPHDGRHAWLRLAPDAVRSWDFRKPAALPTPPDGR